ncbi:MAG: indolepyruvate oxidoreductase [Thermodesulfobacterium geofontis]|uniref:Indolepyruvate oxidoreductase subunit IorA n=1 Tax=Thermodesulfobacterium geofontis TaxID=1295609 RepID=A0A2N7Q7L1_9BACT|nr:MAG: indolepyruvate oxidoreductase [Thermodesulfobacterium geofontis]
MSERIYLSGNEAIAYGLIASGVRFLTGYPGTPSSEILPTAQKLKLRYKFKGFIDWAVNEKVALEMAFSASLCKIKSAVTMKQVGLNVAMDAFVNSAYIGPKAGFVVVVADDPGPYSSQTEQDSRIAAYFAKVPVFDPSSVEEAYHFAKKALELSEEFEIPVLLRTTTALSHGKADISIDNLKIEDQFQPNFKEELKNWEKEVLKLAATPKQRYLLHKALNEKLKAISERNKIRYFYEGDILILSSGMVFSYLRELIEEYNLQQKVTLGKVDIPYPLKKENFSKFKRIITVEETAPVIELFLNTEGRRNGIVPSEGELSPEVCENILAKIGLISEKKTVIIPPLKRPSLCPGCGHRIGLFAVKKVFGKKAIYTGDIGCYTLALNFGVTDTVFCMGAGVSFATGMKKVFDLSGKERMVIGIVGDSTFLHSGIPPLIDAYHYRVPILLIILDNETVGMTGNQKTPAHTKSYEGEPLNSVKIENIVKGIGIEFVKVVDSYEYKKTLAVLKGAKSYLLENEKPAVVILKHPCIYTKEGLEKNPKKPVKIVEEKCTGCKYCIVEFECPALIWDKDKEKVLIDKTLCINCGCCIYVCPKKAIIEVKDGACNTW